MRWMFDLEKKERPELSEGAVDCGTCQVRPPFRRVNQYHREYKCCQFSPFLSSFAVGALLASGQDLAKFYERAEGDLVATRLGILHSHQHRNDNQALCHFFNKKTRECGIWEHRPAICFSFFCVSENSGKWDALEMDLLEQEAAWLSEWHFSEGGSEDDWATWGLVMEPYPSIELPSSLLFENWDEAQAHYQKSWQWLKQKNQVVG